MTKYGELSVELKGRYRAYEERAHTDGMFEVTEVVRHSTAAGDIKACGAECEDIYGADAPTCLAQVDGQCGRTRDSCVGDRSFDLPDTASEYRWKCLGLYGGDNVICTLPKAALQNGAWDYCSSSQPCGVGQGDCDNDRECRPGLRCVDNVRGRYGLFTAIDVCEAPLTDAPAGTLIWRAATPPVVGQPYTVKWASRP